MWPDLGDHASLGCAVGVGRAVRTARRTGTTVHSAAVPCVRSHPALAGAVHTGIGRAGSFDDVPGS